jgi:hypothetical protein
MDLTKLMLNTPAGRTRKQDKVVRRQVASGLSSYVLKGLSGETPEEKQVRLAIEKSNALQAAFAKTEAARDGLFEMGNNDFQLIPMFESTEGKQKFVFKDQTLSIPGYLTTVVANCGASYVAAKALFGDRMDQKTAGRGLENTWAESVAANGAGFIASYVTGALATVGDNFLEDKIQGIFTMPDNDAIVELKNKGKENEQWVVKEDAKDTIMKQIQETKEYKDSKLGTSKAINLGLSILNGAALGYHGFKRNENKSDQEKYLMAAGWAIGGVFGLTNLGYAFAQGFAQPCIEDNSVDFIAISEESIGPRDNPRRKLKPKKHSKSHAKASKAGKKKSSHKKYSR